MNIQDWFSLGLTDSISLQSRGLSRVFSNTIVQKLQCSAFFMVQLSYPYMTTGKTIALTRWTIVGKVMSLLFNMLSRLVIAFLPRSKRLLISWATQDRRVMVERSDTMWSTGEGNGKPLQYSCLENPMNSMKRHKKDNSLGQAWYTETSNRQLYGKKWGFPGGSDKESACRRPWFFPWVEKILWTREWLPTPVFLPGKLHGHRSLVGYSPWGHKEVVMTERLTLHYY